MCNSVLARSKLTYSLAKDKSREKIDAAAAACFAMQVFLTQPQQAKNPSVGNATARFI